MGIQMPANFILFICFGIVGSVLGFIIYGLFRGFENVFKEDENPECKDYSCIEE
jgi:hypothetical protein